MSEAPFDPIHLYIRTDEKYEQIQTEMHDMALANKDMKNNLERVEKRVDFGVAVTGQKNAEELSKQSSEVALLKQTQIMQGMKITELENIIINNHKEIKRMLDPIYKGILAIFFSMLCGGAVMYALKKFGA